MSLGLGRSGKLHDPRQVWVNLADIFGSGGKQKVTLPSTNLGELRRYLWVWGEAGSYTILDKFESTSQMSLGLGRSGKFYSLRHVWVNLADVFASGEK